DAMGPFLSPMGRGTLCVPLVILDIGEADFGPALLFILEKELAWREENRSAIEVRRHRRAVGIGEALKLSAIIRRHPAGKSEARRLIGDGESVFRLKPL